MNNIILDTTEAMAEHVLSWHKNMQDLVHHFLQAPTGIEITVDDQDFILAGDFLKGYEAAMRLIQQELTSRPPLVVTTEDVD
jgi:hypothetical protein